MGGTGNRWELATEWIPGALPLAEILRGTAPWPRGRRAGLRALGRLLARIFEAGLRHSDLHPGNVIFDGEGRAFLVDLRGARFERRPTPPPTILDGTRTDQLIALVAATREMLTPGERSLVLGELVRGLEGQATPPATWRRRVEDEARILRRARCRRRLRVWFRSSKPTREFDAGSGRALRRRDLSLELARAWVLDDQLPTAEGDYSYTGHAYPSSSATRRAWAAAALAEEHHLDAARPAACDLRGARILYRVPRDSRPLTAESARSEHAAALGQLIGSLHDRGLSASLEPGAILCTASDSTLLLAPGFDPRPVDPQPLGPQPLHASQRWDELSASCTALGLDLSAAPAFQDAYLAAQRHSHEERAELRANWGHG
ncbi:MAG: hypothetical protein CMJ87_00105 [Planctomycetes bacterium]|nr:hypothetical protein [Planctomycetota bacterium]